MRSVRVSTHWKGPRIDEENGLRYSSLANQFQIGGCLSWAAQAIPGSSSRSSVSSVLGEANLRIGLMSSKVNWAIRWKAGDNARSGATPLTSQPQTNPKYQFVNALYSFLALFETTNRVLQLVENTLIASLITQRSLVQIQPPQPSQDPGSRAGPIPLQRHTHRPAAEASGLCRGVGTASLSPIAAIWPAASECR